jgi:hypothetical protein
MNATIAPPNAAVGRRFAFWLAILATLCATLGVCGQAANAATVRPMNWNRYDILLTGNETQLAATSYGGAVAVCWGPLLAAALSVNAPRLIATAVVCPAVVTTCAARAYLRHRWAGITVTPFTFNFWCWDY